MTNGNLIQMRFFFKFLNKCKFNFAICSLALRFAFCLISVLTHFFVKKQNELKDTWGLANELMGVRLIIYFNKQTSEKVL